MATDQQERDPQLAEAREALERFVVENDDLLALESRLGRFNIFDALGIARAEIRHSNFLAWLLDPAESHGQGQLFLKAILMDLLKQAPQELRPLSPIDLDGTDLRGVEVEREWKYIDLLIRCQEPSFVVVIENKIDSAEHSDQLSHYEEAMKQEFPNDRALYVYLTVDGDDPSSEAWMSYKHADIYRVLKRVRETSGKSIGDDVLVFLDHYLSLIGTRFMTDERIDELCKRIYKNHRQALQLIWERVGSPASGVMAEVESVLQDDPRWHVAWQGNTMVFFVPTTWLEWVPPLGLDYKDEPRAWIALYFYWSEGKLVFSFEVRRCANVAMRKRIAEFLIAEAPKCGFKPRVGRKVKDNYTGCCGRELVWKLGEDEEPEAEAVREAVKKKLDDVYPRVERLATVLKPLCQQLASANQGKE